jgi:hypothetical protein
MRFIIMGLICLLPLIIGCAGKQTKAPDQVYTAMEDEQSLASTDSAKDVSQSETVTGDEEKSASVDSKVNDAVKHFVAFMSLSATDPEAARAELSEYVDIRFKEHPLADKWMELCYRLARDNKGTFRDMQHFAEWHVQMLTDVVPEKRTEAHTKLLQSLQGSLKYLEAMGKILESQGEDLDTCEMPGTFVAPPK